MYDVIAFAGVIVAVFVPMGIKFERRLTRLETKFDILLNKNGIDPTDCIKKKPKKK